MPTVCHEGVTPGLGSQELLWLGWLLDSADKDLGTRVDRARTRFCERFGREPEGVWAAPGRVNLVGEHTDYNDGFVLPFAIDRTALAALARRPDRSANCHSDNYGSAPQAQLSSVSPDSRPPGWSSYPLGVAWALAGLGLDIPGFDLFVSSTVPLGAGVSSSAALEGCVALGLADLAGAGIERKELALACRRAENEIACAPTGVMDQMASLLAWDGHALFLDCRSLAVRQIPFDPGSQGISVLVIDTKVRHELADGAYGERRKECEAAARLLGVAALRDATLADVDASRAVLGETLWRRSRHVVADNERVLEAVRLLEDRAITRLGAVLSESHASLRDYFEVSCDELDTAVEAAVLNGASGARMIGGGFGGSVIALVPDEHLEQVGAAVRRGSRARGFPDPEIFRARPAPGARRVA
jgi:galactokinase